MPQSKSHALEQRTQISNRQVSGYLIANTNLITRFIGNLYFAFTDTKGVEFGPMQLAGIIEGSF